MGRPRVLAFSLACSLFTMPSSIRNSRATAWGPMRLWPTRLASASMITALFCWVPSPSLASAVFEAGRTGWTLESFAPGTAVLRTVQSEPVGRGEAGVLISCAGSEWRLRLRFSEPIAQSATMAFGRLATGAVQGSPPELHTTIYRFVPSDASTALASDHQPGVHAIASLANQLVSSSATALDILFHHQGAPVAFPRLMVYRLAVRVRPDDRRPIRDFVKFCDLAQ